MSKYYRAEDVINLLATEYYTNALAEGFDVRERDFKEDAIANTKHLPTIEVSEDCISREWLIKALDNLDWYDFDMFYKVVENAPSVVPCCDNEKSNKLQQESQQAEVTTEQSPKVGRWAHYMGDLWTCTHCGESLMCDDIECNNFCPNCGADMRGGDNE